MTHPTPSPEDRFNAYLDALAAGRSTPEASDAFADANADPSVPAETARDLHDLAHAADASQGGPPNSIWENIMNAGVAAPSASPHRIEAWSGPKNSSDSPARPITTFPAERRSRPGWGTVRRASGWLNAIAAAVLLLGIGAGWYFSAIGPGGSGGSGDDGHLAALPAMQDGSPVATPAAMALLGPEDCTVEPLTVDEVIAIVENPNTRIDELGLHDGFSYPSGLFEVSTYGGPAFPFFPGADKVSAPTATQFETIEAMANQYLACLQWGTSLQVWALENPPRVQASILDQFPVYRTEQELRAFIETEGPKAPSQSEWSFFSSNTPNGIVQVSPVQLETAVWDDAPDDVVHAYVGTATYRATDGAELGRFDWTGGMIGVSDSEAADVFSWALAFSYYPDAGVWLFDGTFSLRG